MSDGQVKKCSARLYFLICPALFGNRTSKNLGVLVHRTSEHFKKFFTPAHTNLLIKIFHCYKYMHKSNSNIISSF